MRGVLLKYIKIPVALGLAIAVIVGGTFMVNAETYPGGEDNGKTSRLKQLSGDLATLGYGSPSSDPDWGADWNRISSSAKWHPDTGLTPSDVAAGKSFYNGNRTEQVGTGHLKKSCPTQVLVDGHADANQTSNCVDTAWVAASPALTGDDKKDPATGLVWSRCLLRTGGVNDFSTNNSCTTFTGHNGGANNDGLTAIELCSSRGNGWRLPTQKELMQAYINGSYFNLANVTQAYWSSTRLAPASQSIIRVLLHEGRAEQIGDFNSSSVRCVRQQ